MIEVCFCLTTAGLFLRVLIVAKYFLKGNVDNLAQEQTKLKLEERVFHLWKATEKPGPP